MATLLLSSFVASSITLEQAFLNSLGPTSLEFPIPTKIILLGKVPSLL